MRSPRSLAVSVTVVAVGLLLAAGLASASDEVRAPQTLLPPRAALGDSANGQNLYRSACASCHGMEGAGTANGPSLRGVGAASADFQLSTGRMPFAGPQGSQAVRKPPAFDAQEIADLVAYVASLGPTPAAPAIPQPTLDDALLSRGHEVYVQNCAPCHGATGNGGAVGGGALAPPLDVATATQVQEAMLTGPGQMPRFRLPQEDMDAVATYVGYLRTAPNPGGFTIGGIGPVPEGFVAWAVGVAMLIVIAYLVGREWDRSARRVRHSAQPTSSRDRGARDR